MRLFVGGGGLQSGYTRDGSLSLTSLCPLLTRGPSLTLHTLLRLIQVPRPAAPAWRRARRRAALARRRPRSLRFRPLRTRPTAGGLPLGCNRARGGSRPFLRRGSSGAASPTRRCGAPLGGGWRRSRRSSCGAVAARRRRGRSCLGAHAGPPPGAGAGHFGHVRGVPAPDKRLGALQLLRPAAARALDGGALAAPLRRRLVFYYSRGLRCLAPHTNGPSDEPRCGVLRGSFFF
jgi:hypothetical protein